jgi:hypothetical protein
LALYNTVPEPRFDIADAFAEKMRAYATYSKQKRLEERARVEEERVKAAKEAIRMAQEKVTVIAKEVKQRKLESSCCRYISSQARDKPRYTFWR